MVATTTTFHLPYQTGTDPPCFGPGAGCTHLNSVWCDFAAIVETQLDLIDAVVGRTATAIPMAKIRYQTSAVDLADVVTLAGGIPFDSVVFDTDNMVDLNLVQGIIPNRNGIYMIDFWATFLTNGADNDAVINVSVDTELEPIFLGQNKIAIASATTRTGPFTPNGSGFSRCSTLWKFDSINPNPRAVVAAIDNVLPVTEANLQVTWFSEEV